MTQSRTVNTNTELLRVLGIPTNNVTAVNIKMRVGSLPIVTVQSFIVDGERLQREVQRFQLVATDPKVPT